jgi:hypothetical protein
MNPLVRPTVRFLATAMAGLFAVSAGPASRDALRQVDAGSQDVPRQLRFDPRCCSL